MKMENLPVKIDCYKLKNFRGNVNDASKEHIGYIIVPVRNIPIYPMIKAIQVKPRWLKIIGLNKEWRNHHPELLLNVMITEKAYLTTDKSVMMSSHGLESGDSIVVEENPSPCMLTSQRGIFIRLLQEEGLLQVGNIDTDCDIFVVKILIKNIKFLDSVVGDVSDVCSDRSNREFYINYMLLGNPHIRTLEKKFNRIHQIQEKISINFRSSLRSLKEYFEQIFFIPIEVFLSTRRIGTTEIRLRNHILTTDLNEFVKKFPKCYEFDGTSDIQVPSSADAGKDLPIMEYKVVIQYRATKKLHQTELLETYKKHQTYDPRGGGDYLPTIPEKPANDNAESVDERQWKAKSLENNESQFKVVGVGKGYRSDKDSQQSKKIEPTKKISVVQSEKADIESMLHSQEEGQVSDLPRLFSYNLQLKSVKLNRRPQRGIWQISFYHEKADTPRTFINRDISDANCVDDENTINFNDLELKLYFTSFAENIMDVIKSSSVCTLCIKGPHNTHAKAQLDCKSLLISNKEKTSGNILLTNQNESVSALAQIFVYLDDLGLNFNAKISRTESQVFHDEFEPPHMSSMNVTKTLDNNQKSALFDEDIAYKMIEELEEWKVQEQNTFLMELKKTEKTYLDKLNAAWADRKKHYEVELMEKTNKLSVLSKSLQDLQKNLAERDEMQLKTEDEIINYKHDLERAYKDQLLVIKEKARQLEDDLMHEMRLKDIKIDELQQTSKILETENCELKRLIEEMKIDKGMAKSNLVSREEHNRVLREMVKF